MICQHAGSCSASHYMPNATIIYEQNLMHVANCPYQKALFYQMYGPARQTGSASSNFIKKKVTASLKKC